jgi:hypothetical protein
MKIWFRIGAKQDGPHSPKRYSSTGTKMRLSRPFALLALTSEESICDRARFSLWPRPLQAQPAGPETAPTPKKSVKIESFFARWARVSTRQWAKSRCYTKQRTKPRLTGTRTVISDFGFLALSTRDSARNFEQRRFSATRPSPAPPASRRRVSTTEGPREIRRSHASDCTTSTRFCPKSRSYRKQMIKPFLPGATTARCDAPSLLTFRVRRSCPDEAREHPRTGAVQATHISLANPRRNTGRGPRNTSTLKDFRRGARVLLLPEETATNGLHRTYPE